VNISWKSDEQKIAQEERMKNNGAGGNAVQGPAATTTGSGPQDWEPIGQDFDDEKNCGACTMLNPRSATSCFVCGTPFN